MKSRPLSVQHGLTLVELMVAMAIGLVIVIAATTIYLNTMQTRRSLERQGSSMDSGLFALKMLGRDLMNAGAYPANFLPIAADLTQQGMYDTYPPLEYKTADPKERKITDWQNSSIGWPPAPYMTGIYGCDRAVFNVATATCPAPDSNLNTPDSIVINYFTADATGSVNTKNDCTNSNVENDPSNANRVSGKNGKQSARINIPPLLPLWVSNRYSLNKNNNFTDNSSFETFSLACSGNGSNWHGTKNAYQPIIQGMKNLKFSYGVFENESSLVPARFYSASEISALPSVNILGQSLTGWQRVTSVRVCVLSQTLGGGVRLADKKDDEKVYLDCSDQSQKQPTGQPVYRYVQIFGVRNGLKQSY